MKTCFSYFLKTIRKRPPFEWEATLSQLTPLSIYAMGNFFVNPLFVQNLKKEKPPKF